MRTAYTSFQKSFQKNAISCGEGEGRRVGCVVVGDEGCTSAEQKTRTPTQADNNRSHRGDAWKWMRAGGRGEM
jgi:hypothetical protein